MAHENTKDYRSLPYAPEAALLTEALGQRVLVLDGAMGTQIQARELTEEDFRGDRFAAHPRNLAGCNDILCLTRPDVIRDIHSAYLAAGADIIETNTFNANRISMAEYAMEEHVAEINRRGVELAREAAMVAMAADPSRPRWVAATMGPTSKALSMASSMEDASPITWDILVDAYTEQARALIESGTDIILLETVFDSLNVKAGIYAATRAMIETGRRVPLMVSVTLTEQGRTLSGQTLDAFIATVSHADPISVGLNCGFGAAQLMPFVRSLADVPFAVSFHPNAGLPNDLGGYDETPETMAEALRPLLQEGALNIVGGCCGTAPAHIAAIAAEAASATPRAIPSGKEDMLLSGLSLTSIPAGEHPFTMIGERCNVAGSRKFLRLIKEKNYDEALDIARAQVRAGASIIDVNLDDAMLDAPAEMARFLELLADDAVTAAVPVMIDSSAWPVIEEGLKHLRGRGIVNSISLKEGEEAFKARALHIRDMGCAAVVMAMDETSQADTYERKMEVVRRQYDILTRECGYLPSHIVFDPNVLAVATGIEAHDAYGLAFIRAAKSIRSEMPGVHVSGGISNLSFSFRGNNTVREAMHAELLRLAHGGLDMGIVNPSAMKKPEDFDPALIKAVSHVLLNDLPGASDHLVELASEIMEKIRAAKEAASGTPKTEVPAQDAAPKSASEKIAAMIVAGRHEGIEALLQQEVEAGKAALTIVDESLMGGMNEVGRLFGDGRIFLPQVVRSARAMKQAVKWLTPLIEAENTRKDTEGPATRAPRVVLATVKGDVHDIGKNIVAIILRCNGFEVDDLGVMVPAETIIEHARANKADMIGLSGLITPSLHEMQAFAALMESEELDIPLFVGGAATSAIHTAVRIAPGYHGQVFHTVDAAQLPGVARAWLNPETRAQAVEENLRRQELLRFNNSHHTSLLPLEEAEKLRYRLPADAAPSSTLAIGTEDRYPSVADIRPFINWRAFLIAWGLDASLASVMDIHGCDHCKAQWLASLPQEKRAKGAEAMQLLKEAGRMLDRIAEATRETGLNVRTVTLPAAAVGNDIILQRPDGSEVTISTLRQQTDEEGKERLSLADFVLQRTADDPWPDRLTFFANTPGLPVAEMIRLARDGGDDFDSLLIQSLADRLAEGSTEWLHHSLGNIGIRPAIGYMSLPDQSLVFEADRMLRYSDLGISLTENGALFPQSSTTGFFILRPEARYFSVGDIGPDQLQDYARRRGKSVEELTPFLAPRIAE